MKDRFDRPDEYSQYWFNKANTGQASKDLVGNAN